MSELEHPTTRFLASSSKLIDRIFARSLRLHFSLRFAPSTRRNPSFPPVATLPSGRTHRAKSAPLCRPICLLHVRLDVLKQQISPGTNTEKTRWNKSLRGSKSGELTFFRPAENRAIFGELLAKVRLDANALGDASAFLESREAIPFPEKEVFHPSSDESVVVLVRPFDTVDLIRIAFACREHLLARPVPDHDSVVAVSSDRCQIFPVFGKGHATYSALVTCWQLRKTAHVKASTGILRTIALKYVSFS
jgi:hypothetical protein